MAQRILVAEDEPVVAFDLCETVREAGYEVEGPHRDIASAMLASQKGLPDLAILDITLGQDEAYSLARKLAEENVPIIFHSGRHAREEVAARFPQAMTLLKPCPPADMLLAVNTSLNAAQA